MSRLRDVIILLVTKSSLSGGKWLRKVLSRGDRQKPPTPQCTRQFVDRRAHCSSFPTAHGNSHVTMALKPRAQTPFPNATRVQHKVTCTVTVLLENAERAADGSHVTPRVVAQKTHWSLPCSFPIHAKSDLTTSASHIRRRLNGPTWHVASCSTCLHGLFSACCCLVATLRNFRLIFS